MFDGAALVEAAHQADAAPEIAPAQEPAPAVEPPAPPAETTHTPLPATAEREGASAEAPAAGSVVYVVDQGIAHWRELVNQLPADSEVVLIDSARAGTAQLAEALAGRSGIATLHILGHGSDGGIALGNQALNAQNLAATGADWQAIGAALAADGDILLYGCDVAAGGTAFIDRLAALTGADVAASTDATGISARGGNWTLEAHSGTVESLALAGLAYDGLLAAPTVTDANAGFELLVGEDATAAPIGSGLSVSGTGGDTLSVTLTVGQGTLDFSVAPPADAVGVGTGTVSFTGTAAEVQGFLQNLTYRYTGTSELGASDTLAIVVTNDSSGGSTALDRALSITAQNDAPALSPPASGAGRLSVQEGGSASFAAATGAGPAGAPVTQLNLGLVDPDNTPEQIIIKLTGLPSQGVLLLDGKELTTGSTFSLVDIGNLTYRHDGAQVTAATTDTFVITVDDGAGGLLTLQTVTVDITPDNDAPQVGGSVTLIEGETDVSLVGGVVPVMDAARGDLAITDPDDASHSITVVSLPVYGVLRYDGAAVTAGQVIADADPSLFTYSHDGSETTADSFVVRVTDAGGGEGAGSALTTADTTIDLIVLPNNDDPTLARNTGVVYGPDSGAGAPLDGHTVTVTTDMLQVTDVDSPVAQLTYTLTAIPDTSLGYLTYAGSGLALPVGFSFTQADLDAGRIQFVALVGGDFDTAFSFTVQDGDRRLLPSPRDGGIYADDTAGAALTVSTFSIAYRGTTADGSGLPAPFPPFAEPNAPGGSLQLTIDDIAEGQTVVLDATHLLTTDADNSADELVYRLLSLPGNGSILLNGVALSLYGSFTQADVDAGRVAFRHDGGEDFTSSFLFDVSDGASTTAVTAFNIDVRPQNDTPTASAGVPVKLSEGGIKVIDGTHIVLHDADNDPSDKTDGYAADNELHFVVTALPAHGELRLNGVALGLGGTVTQAQLLAGLLTYAHDGSESFTDSFTIVPVDDRSVTVPGNPADAPASNPTNQLSQGAPRVIDITINPLNDAPTYVSQAEPGDGNVPLLAEGGTLIIAGATYASGDGSGPATSPGPSVAHLIYQDADNSSVQRQYRLTTATQYGTLYADGRALSVGSVFTQAQLDAGLVRYVHGGGETSLVDHFDYVVSDGDYTSNQGTTDNASAAAQGDPIAPSTYTIRLAPTNDAPAITAPSGPINLGSATEANNPVAGVSVSDPDLTDGVDASESDFIQVTVRVLDADGNPITDYASGFAGGGVTFGYAVPATPGPLWAAVNDGDDDGRVVNDVLVLQGTRAEVNAALAGLTVTFQNDANAIYRLQIIADDRMRDATGALDASGSDANGGELNQGTGGGAPTAVPGTVYDWRSSVAVPTGDGNIRAAEVVVRASRVNEPATVSAPAAFTVDEDTWTRLGPFDVADPESDAFGTAVSVTLQVNSGTLNLGGTTASTSLTPAGGQAVAISGDNTGTVTLVGRAADIQALLNGRNVGDTADDPNGGLSYRSATHVNHDTNQAETVTAGDVTLTVTFNDGASNIGSDGAANAPVVATTALTITAINDAPAVGAGSGTVPVAGTEPTAVGGFVINDPDSANGYADGETDGDLSVIVRLLDAGGNPLAAADYATLGVVFDSSAAASGATALGGGNDYLELRGTLAEINAYLSGLRVTFGNLAASNVDTTFHVEVVADDRIIDAATGAPTAVANGGSANQQSGLPAVPTTDTFDPYGTQVAGYGVYNVTSGTRTLFVSSINDPGRITASDVTVNEGSATLALDASNANITIDDPDDNGAGTLSATVTVGAGTITAVGGSGGTVSGLGSASVTITGATEAQLNARLRALTIALPDPAGAPTAADWNGTFDVTVVYNDAGSTGTRPGALAGDSDDAGADPGDYSYADGSSNVLVTTRTFTVTITGENDAPVVTTPAVSTPAAGTEDTDGGSGHSVADLFGGAFSDPLDNVAGGTASNGFAGVAITGNDALPAQGVWQYSTDGGATWTDLPAVSETDALLLSAATLLRFDPADDFHGTPGGLTARVVDDSGSALVSGSTADVSGANSGGSTRYSDAANAVTLATTVANVNDRPTGSDATLAAISEDVADPPGATVASLGFGYADAADDQSAITGGGDAATAFGGIAIVGNAADAATEGVWQYNTGSGWTDVGSPSAASALVLPTTAELRFVPAADFNGTPGALQLHVADSVQAFAAGADITAALASGQTSTWSTALSLGTSVAPRNDAPTITHPATNPSVTENGSAGGGVSVDPVALLGAGTVGDLDLATTPGLAAGVFGAGTLTVTLTDGVAGDVLRLAPGVTAGVAGVTGGTGSTPLVVTLTATATTAQVEAILAAVQYLNTGDNPTDSGTDTTRSYTVVLSDGNNVQAGGHAGGPDALAAATVHGTITIAPINEPPLAVDDANEVTEDGGTPATGNVITGAGSPASTPDSDPDYVDDVLSVTGIRTGGEAAPGTDVGVAAGTTAADGTVVAGQYGTLTIGADGSYSYVLDETHPAVNALRDGETLVDRFSYTLSDGTHTDRAELAITIRGHTDGPPAIAPVDGNGADVTGEATVHEAGLTSADDARETATGTLTVSAPDGIATVTLGGQTFTIAQLAGFTPDAPSAGIDTGEGILRVTGLTVTAGDPGAPTQAVVSYVYTLSAPLTIPGAESTDVIALGVTDASTGAVTAGGSLTVRIVNDAPQARDDRGTAQIGIPDPTASGNVITGDGADDQDDQADRPGADGPVVVTGVAAGGVPGTLGAAIVGQYGSLVLQADGSYRYTPDGDDAAVRSLTSDQSLTDTFTYTITDADGDTSTATLTITVRGSDLRLPDYVYNGLDQFDPPIIPQPFEPAVHVQVAVRDSAALIGVLSGQMADGQGLAFDEEIQGGILGIAQDMTNAQHVSRDGVAFSRQLLAEGQSRARSLGNSLVVGAQTLFDDFSPFGPKPVDGGPGAADAEAPADAPAAAAEAEPAERAQPVATAPRDGAHAVPVARGAPSFSAQLDAAAAARAVLRELQTASAHEAAAAPAAGRPVPVARAQPVRA